MSNIDPLANAISRDFGLDFSCLTKQEIFNNIVTFSGPKSSEPELLRFYTETMLNASDSQHQVVARLYDNFFRAFAEGRRRFPRQPENEEVKETDAEPTEDIETEDMMQERHTVFMNQEFVMPQALVDTIKREKLNYEFAERIQRQEFVEKKFKRNQIFEDNKKIRLNKKLKKKKKERQTNCQHRPATNTYSPGSGIVDDDATTKRDAKSFARLLKFAAKYPCVRAIFLHFRFSEWFVDEFNKANGNRTFLPSKVLKIVLNQIKKKSNGLWGKKVGKYSIFFVL